jgi:coproporphyrinogen III oxidase
MSASAVAVELESPVQAFLAHRSGEVNAVGRERVQAYFEDLQNRICTGLMEVEGQAFFHEDRWSYDGGGGGKTRVLQNGAVFEKAGVNFSAIEGTIASEIAARMHLERVPFFATGVSLVIHPLSPMVPIVHLNVRYFEQSSGAWWFGGGMDLSPCYPFIEDILHFHETLRTACEKHNPFYYSRFKKWCDEYFQIRHRNEMRGVGGIFFDHVRGDATTEFAFIREVGDAFLGAYLPIVKRRCTMAYGRREREFQLIRRARYVEFNLVYDRGTAFGLETRGRIESILMSMPPVVHWPYGWSPEPGSREAELSDYLVPRDWLSPDVKESDRKVV